MHILRTFKDGTTDVVQTSSLKTFKRSSMALNPDVIALAIIDAVTQVVIALIRKPKPKPKVKK